MRRAAAILLPLLLAPPVPAQEIYDLLLKGGHVIDPKNKRNERLDIAITAGKIRRIARGIPAAHGRHVVDVSEYYVTPGLIDIHTHFDAYGDPHSLNPDHNSLRYGVTTAVDAGSSGWKTFEAFKSNVIDHARTRVLAFINIVGGGMSGIDNEQDPGAMDPEATARTARKYPETIVGIKTAHFQSATWDAVDRAVKAAALSNTIVMVDFQPKPGRGYRELILEHVRPGDIHTHVYGRVTPQLDEQKVVRGYMWEARKRGVLFDVGHGAGSLWFRIAAPAVKQGFLPDTISTDIHKRSIMIPRATMTNVMSKFLAMGMTLEQLIERTTINPARAIRRPELGSLEEGGVADIAVLEVRPGEFGFLDSGHAKLTANREIRCVLTVRNGQVVWDSEGLSAADWRETGDYSNFK